MQAACPLSGGFLEIESASGFACWRRNARQNLTESSSKPAKRHALAFRGNPTVCFFRSGSGVNATFSNSFRFNEIEGNGAPGETRTRDPLLRRQMLYPTELRARWSP